jgi:hypothetical protein
MSARLADLSGMVATVAAGVLLAALSISAFGTGRTLLGFLSLSLLATTSHREITRNR